MGSVRRRHVWSRTQSRHSVQASTFCPSGVSASWLAARWGPDDEVRFVLENANGWAFVALQDRVVIARAGVAAGATFGGRVSQFLYRDIINVAQNTGMLTAVIEIHTPAHQGNAVGVFWSSHTSVGGT